MWWILLAVPAALLVDAMLDPDRRARLAETGPFGPYWLADKWDRFVDALKPEPGGYRPKPRSLPKAAPPGPSAVPRKRLTQVVNEAKAIAGGCYKANRHVNPRTFVQVSAADDSLWVDRQPRYPVRRQ